MRTNQLCCLDTVIVGGIEATITDVVKYRTSEEMRLLQDDGHTSAQRLLLNVSDRDAVVKDLALLDVVETVDEVDNRGLACARAANEGNLLTRLRVDVDIEEHLLLRHIAKVHVLKVHIALRVCQLLCPLIHLQLSIA